MAEVLVEFTDPVVSDEGDTYIARACGGELDDTGRWQGWIEFVPQSGGEVLRSARETTQPNRADTLYWATGLTAVYLEGSLQRTLHPLVKRAPKPIDPPVFDGPAPPFEDDAPAPNDSVLNPFSVYRKGESLLRDQLNALSAWHLVNIIRAHRLSSLTSTQLNGMNATQLVELIVANVRAQQEPVAK